MLSCTSRVWSQAFCLSGFHDDLGIPTNTQTPADHLPSKTADIFCSVSPTFGAVRRSPNDNIQATGRRRNDAEASPNLSTSAAFASSFERGSSHSDEIATASAATGTGTVMSYNCSGASPITAATTVMDAGLLPTSAMRPGVRHDKSSLRCAHGTRALDPVQQHDSYEPPQAKACAAGAARPVHTPDVHDAALPESPQLQPQPPPRPQPAPFPPRCQALQPQSGPQQVQDQGQDSAGLSQLIPQQQRTRLAPLNLDTGRLSGPVRPSSENVQGAPIGRTGGMDGGGGGWASGGEGGLGRLTGHATAVEESVAGPAASTAAAAAAAPISPAAVVLTGHDSPAVQPVQQPAQQPVQQPAQQPAQQPESAVTQQASGIPPDPAVADVPSRGRPAGAGGNILKAGEAAEIAAAGAGAIDRVESSSLAAIAALRGGGNGRFVGGGGRAAGAGAGAAAAGPAAATGTQTAGDKGALALARDGVGSTDLSVVLDGSSSGGGLVWCPADGREGARSDDIGVSGRDGGGRAGCGGCGEAGGADGDSSHVPEAAGGGEASPAGNQRPDMMGRARELVALGRQLMARLARVQEAKANLVRMESVLEEEVANVRESLRSVLMQQLSRRSHAQEGRQQQQGQGQGQVPPLPPLPPLPSQQQHHQQQEQQETMQRSRLQLPLNRRPQPEPQPQPQPLPESTEPAFRGSKVSPVCIQPTDTSYPHPHLRPSLRPCSEACKEQHVRSGAATDAAYATNDSFGRGSEAAAARPRGRDALPMDQVLQILREAATQAHEADSVTEAFSMPACLMRSPTTGEMLARKHAMQGAAAVPGCTAQPSAHKRPRQEEDFAAVDLSGSPEMASSPPQLPSPQPRPVPVTAAAAAGSTADTYELERCATWVLSELRSALGTRERSGTGQADVPQPPRPSLATVQAEAVTTSTRAAAAAAAPFQREGVPQPLQNARPSVPPSQFQTQAQERRRLQALQALHMQQGEAWADKVSSGWGIGDLRQPWCTEELQEAPSAAVIGSAGPLSAGRKRQHVMEELNLVGWAEQGSSSREARNVMRERYLSYRQQHALRDAKGSDAQGRSPGVD